ncbi:MAG: SCP2 sterol-binding domain-containing protein [Acidiferrobacterales bacterium]|nr:SCP2 sterol-binding domain-containing protein [Acidiferrobacterales bacterium]
MERFFLEAINRAIQSVLSVDPDSVKALAALTGKVYRINLTVPPITLFLLPDPEGLCLQTECAHTPDVTLTGSVFAFAKLGSKSGGRTNSGRIFSDGQITMEGDAEAGQALQRVLAQFDLDWEELIARAVGDLPARKVGNAFRDFGGWAEKTAKYTRTNFSDYLTEESRVMASKVGMQRFERGVTELRSDIDRVGLRVEKLLNRRSAGE